MFRASLCYIGNSKPAREYIAIIFKTNKQTNKKVTNGGLWFMKFIYNTLIKVVFCILGTHCT